MTTGPKKTENRGGKRKGAGRKNVSVSKDSIARMWKAADLRVKSGLGKHPDEILLDIMNFGDVNQKLKALDLFYKYANATVGSGDEKGSAKIIALPRRAVDPGKAIAGGS